MPANAGYGGLMLSELIAGSPGSILDMAVIQKLLNSNAIKSQDLMIAVEVSLSMVMKP